MHKADLATFVATLGLTLVLDDVDGFAYLKHSATESEEQEVIWMQRRQFTYEESILLVLLREMMAEFETGEATTRELIRKRRELKEYAELFFKEKASRVKFFKDIDQLIDKLADYRLLNLAEDHEIPDEQRFRIPKLIKHRVSADVLENFARQLRDIGRQEGEVNQLPLTDNLPNL